MSSELRLRRGSTAATAVFTGADGEVTFNTDTNELVTHDGVTPGGFTVPLKSDLAASGGSSLVGYLPAGTGAVATDVQSKLRSLELADYAALRAFTGEVSHVQIVAEGIAGLFIYDESDTTSADNGGTVLVDASGRRWKRVYDGAVDVCWFGADRAGVTSSVTAVNAAIAWANTQTYPITIAFPEGEYDLTAGVTQAVERSYISFDGRNSKINCRLGYVFRFYKSATNLYRNHVMDFWFQYPLLTGSPAIPDDVNAIPLHYTQGCYFNVTNCNIKEAPAAIYVTACSNYNIDGIYGNTINVARPAIGINASVVGYIDNISLYNRVDLQPQNPATSYPLPPVSGNVFIQVTGTCDTLRLGESVLSNRYHRGFRSIVNAGEVQINFWSKNLIVDYCYDRGIYILNNGGSIANINFSKPYVQAMQGIGIEVHHNATTGLTQGINIDCPVVIMSGSHAIKAWSSTSTVCLWDVTITNPKVVGSNRLGAGGYDIYAYSARVNVFGGRVGYPSSIAGASYSCQATYGVLYDSCDQYIVKDVYAGGTGASYSFNNNPASTYRARLVTDNHVLPDYSALDRPEYVTSTTLISVVSGDLYTNNTPYKQQVSFYAISTSGAAVIEVNGSQYSTHTEWSGVLMPGDTVKNTTAVPSYRRISNLP